MDVAKLSAEDEDGDALTGGYILKVDKVTAEDFALRPAFELPPRGLRGQPTTQLLYHYPKPRDITEAQRDYARGWMSDFEARLASPDYEDRDRGYRSVIDEESFIDYLFVNEITKNVDAYRLSTYLYKERDSDGGRLHMGPVWDYNLALANARLRRRRRGGELGIRFRPLPPGRRLSTTVLVPAPLDVGGLSPKHGPAVARPTYRGRGPE